MASSVNVTTIDDGDRVHVTVRGGGYRSERTHVRNGTSPTNAVAAERTVREVMGDRSLKVSELGVNPTAASKNLRGYRYEVV